MKYDIAIARFPGDGWERHELVDWLVSVVLQMKQDDRIGKIFRQTYAGDTPVTMLRNRAVLEARRNGAAYLLMADADMVPDLYVTQGYPPLESGGSAAFWNVAWEFMMDRRVREAEIYPTNNYVPSSRFLPATIAAPYCGPPPDELPYVFRFVNRQSDNPNPDWKLGMIPREMAAIMGGIQQMDALATGLILYDMRVFDILKPPWFRYEYSDETESQKVTTEDVYQTRNAGLLGMPQFAAMDCWSGHAKWKTVGKPIIIPRERIAQAYRDAVQRDVGAGQRLLVLAGNGALDLASEETDALRRPGAADDLTEAAMAADWNPPHEPAPPRPPFMAGEPTETDQAFHEQWPPRARDKP